MIKESLKVLLLTFLLPLVLWTQKGLAHADATRDQEIESFLKEFQSNPQEAMMSIPPKWDANGVPRPTREFEPLDAATASKHALVRSRIMSRGSRREVMAGSPLLRAELAPAPIDMDNDDPAKVVESPETLARTLEALDAAKMTSGMTAVDEWSGHYWPYYLGVAANRYADPLFPENTDWSANQAYIQSSGHSLVEILARNGADAIDTLSPAEKYDAITGNVDGPLTAAMWKAVKKQDKDGDLDQWEGICEGWSAAAIRTARPAHAISVQDPSGRSLTFYPSDVKALGSLLWAWGDIDTRFAGGRCDEDDPKTDENGRIVSEDCFETNPATWHLVVTQQLGRLRSPFIMDASFDTEVWNQPVQKYVYSYFNPQTGRSTAVLSEAKVALADYTNDKFTSYRSKDAVSVVGIAMDVTYVAENESPTQAPTDTSAQDSLTTVRYVYDLELDADNQIIGGEWYHNAHPNFVWMPEPGAQAVSVAEDAAVEPWSGTGVIPATWAQAARTAAGSAQPLAKVVEVLESLAK